MTRLEASSKNRKRQFKNNRAQPAWKIILELKSKIGAKEDEFNSDGYRKSNFISPNNN